MPHRYKRREHGEAPIPLTHPQQQFNSKFGSDRVLVGNYFGRMKGVFGIISTKHRCGVNSMETLIHICVALTNFLVERHPLRQIQFVSTEEGEASSSSSVEEPPMKRMQKRGKK